MERLFNADPNIVRRCLKKLIVIERDPRAGEPLLGGLVGFRKITARIKAAGASPATKALTDVLAMFEKQSRGLSATPEPVEPEGTPQWLINALVRVVGLRPEVVKAMSPDEADAAWTAHITAPGSQS